MWYYYSYYFKIFLLVSKGNKSTNFSIGPILKSNSSSVFCINEFISKWKSLLSQWEEKESQAFGSLFTELKNLLSLKQCFTHVTNWMYTQNSLTVRCLWFSWGVVAHVKVILNCARSSNGSRGLHECGWHLHWLFFVCFQVTMTGLRSPQNLSHQSAYEGSFTVLKQSSPCHLRRWMMTERFMTY